MDHESIECLKIVDSDYDVNDVLGQGFSFPSGHATNSFLGYGSIAHGSSRRWVRILAGVLILLVGLSRCALGVHYPTDVLCGWLLGLIVLVLCDWLQRRIARRWLLDLILLCLLACGCLYCTSSDYYMAMGLLAGFFAGTLFEARFVKFRETSRWQYRILRTVCALVLFLGISAATKLPFPEEILSAAGPLAWGIRAARYFVTSFLVIGVYPMAFAKIERSVQAQ